jgi:hypothetical protein
VFDAWQSVISSSHMADFMRNLLRPDAFRNFLVIGPEESGCAAPQIKQAVPVTFEFVNTGTVPLVISQVQGSCGCTATDYSTAPIPPGKSSKIVATYNAAAPGVFHKTVTVTTTADTSSPQVLTLQGTVVASAE